MVRAPNVLFLSAVEPSGDRLGACLVRALRDAGFDGKIVGLGGPLMAREGLETVAGIPPAKSGFWDVLPSLPAYVHARRALKERLFSSPYATWIAIDAPDFHESLLRHAAHAGVRCGWLAPPQAWAWRSTRADHLAAAGIPLGVLFPFERKFFVERGCRATLLGHPMRRTAAGPSEPGRELLLLPGSRPAQFRRNLEWQLRLWAELRRLPAAAGAFSGARVVCASEACERTARSALAGGKVPEFGISRSLEESCAGASAALCCPGTASLELALNGIPTAVTMRLDPLTAFLAKRMVKSSRLALPNLLLGADLLPEAIFGPWDAPDPRLLAERFARSFEVQRPGCSEISRRLELTLGARDFAARAVDWVREVSDGLLQGLQK